MRSQTPPPPHSLDSVHLAVQARSLTAAQIQMAQNITSAELQDVQSKMQPAIADLQNQIAAHRQAPNLPTWQQVVGGTAQPAQPASIRSAIPGPLTFASAYGSLSSVQPAAVYETGGLDQSMLASSVWQPLTRSSISICPVWGCGGPPPPPRFQPDLDQDGLPDRFEAPSPTASRRSTLPLPTSSSSSRHLGITFR